MNPIFQAIPNRPTGGEGVTNAYDGFGRLISTALLMDGVSRPLAFKHKRNGLRTEIAWPDDSAGSRRTSFVHDGMGRMRRVFQGPEGTGAASAQLFSYTYGAPGDVARLDRLGGSHTLFTRDGLGRPTLYQDRFTPAAGASVSAGNNDTGLAYNPASQIVTEERSNDAYLWNGAVALGSDHQVNGLNQYQQTSAW